MILNNIKPVNSDDPINIKIDGGKIVELSSSPIAAADALQLDFNNAIVFPGLINSHDHLDFNLFPQLGNQLYNNYTEWGKHIHERYKPEIAEVLKIPVELRSKWGIYKNLLCGVTTVINHGEKRGTANDLITVFEDTHCIHSVGFEKRCKLKLNNPLKKRLLVNIHVGEGIDLQSENEIKYLLKWNILNRKLVAVHAVAMTEVQAKEFEAVVWCPQSNYFLLNKTSPVDLLKKHLSILFGTDSTLTSEWDIWRHLQSARKSQLLNDDELYNAVTINASQTWGLNSGEIIQGKNADLVIAKRSFDNDGFDAFYAITPADLLLVIHQGEIRLFDEELLEQLSNIKEDFSKIYINGVCKYVQGNLPGLMADIRRFHPNANFPKNITITD
ncbi:amidohydrolase family protein [Mucilaginibacter sp. L196]|uniref:amidohydrolase family protein n=1 Tax=Mucilaginibacter sp. L196 TaxID=1641870 RepID=UPI00131AFD45|nr:amidohydrolase family protein [Mucilaginibacter sp. L196]